MAMYCYSIMIAESGREWWGHVAESGEKETHTEFLYKILKGIGHLEYVGVRSRLDDKLSLEICM